MTTQLELCNQPTLMSYRRMLYLLTPCSTIPLEKLTGCQLVKKFPALYGTRRFITAFASACHLSVSWASSIHSIPSPPKPGISILMLSSHLCLCLPSGLFPSGFHPKTLCTPHPTPYVLHATPILFFSECYRSNNSRQASNQKGPVLLYTSQLFAVTVAGTTQHATVNEQTNSKSQSAITALSSFSGRVSPSCAGNVGCSCHIFFISTALLTANGQFLSSATVTFRTDIISQFVAVFLATTAAFSFLSLHTPFH